MSPYEPPIALSVRAHDRAGARRTDDAWLAATWADPGTRVLRLGRGRFPVTREEDGVRIAWCAPHEAPDGQRVFLGEQDGVARFAVLLDEPGGDDWAGFREVGPLLGAEDAGILVHAVALAEWHHRHRFCPRCGGRLSVAAAGHVLTCTGCGREQFPRTDPAVIMLVVDGDDRALLGRKPEWPDGRYSTLAGFVDPGESLEDAVRREVFEEAGVEVGRVRYFGNQPWPFPASLMVGFVAEARSTVIQVDGEEISDARWFTRDEVHEQAASGVLFLPGGISISRSLVESWFGGPLPGSW